MAGGWEQWRQEVSAVHFACHFPLYEVSEVRDHSACKTIVLR